MKKILGHLVLVYLRGLARVKISRIQPLIIGITGSAGKTSTRNAVAAVLPESAKVKISYKANSESGIPLNILGVTPRNYSVVDWLRMMIQGTWQAWFSRERFDIYIAEMGVDSPKSPKNMDYLLSIIQPQVGIFLNALPVHAAAFDPGVGTLNPSDHQQAIIAAIAQEKAKLILRLPPKGVGIVNADDPAVMKYTQTTTAPLLTFGKSEAATVVIRSIERSLVSTAITFTHNAETATVKLPYALPDHFGYTLAAALCLVVYRQESLIEGCRRIQARFTLPPGRMTLLKGINDSILIDSSYNASAEPTIDALQMLATLPAKRHIALLGDMRELGKETQIEHERVIEAALDTANVVYVVGPLMNQYGVSYAEKLGKPIQWFTNSRVAGDYLEHTLQAGDVLLIKGSQNTILMEIAVEMLLKNKADSQYLCRRGVYWDRLRARIH